MPEIQPLFLQGGGTLEYDPKEMRVWSSALLAGAAFYTATTEDTNRGEGVLSANALEVTAQVTPNNTVNVSSGIASVRGTQSDDQGLYLCPLSASVTVTFADADATNDRTDLVVAQVRDNAYPDFVQDDWDVVIVQGTPGAGRPAMTNDALVLASVDIPGVGGTAVVHSTDITDERAFARCVGGIVPVIVRDNYPNPEEFDAIWEISTETLLFRIDGDWVTIGLNFDNSWEEFGVSGSRFNNVTVGNGSDYGLFSRFGKTIIGVAGFNLGDTGEAVTGTISLNLPSTAEASDNIRYKGGGQANDFSTGLLYASIGEINPDSDPSILTNFGTFASLPWGSGNPFTWSNFDDFHVFFMYQEA